MALTPVEKIAFELLDKWLVYQAKYADITGYQISIRKKGNLIFNKAYGYANIEKKTPYKTSHVGHIASHSKMFTACAALQLQQAGVLSLTDPMVKYLPELTKHKDKRFKDVDLDQYNYATSSTGLQSPTVRSYGLNLNVSF